MFSISEISRYRFILHIVMRAVHTTRYHKFNLRDGKREREKERELYHCREHLRDGARRNVLILFSRTTILYAVTILPYTIPHGIPSHIRRNVPR